MKKYLIVSIFILGFNSLWAQLFIGYNTGYDISANRFEVFQKESPFIQHSYVNADSSIYLPLGEGFRNSLSLGYKCNSLLFDLSVGGNFSKLNFNYLNEKNSYSDWDKAFIRTYYDTAYVGPLYSPYFDEYLTMEDNSKISIMYNVVNITPSLSYITGKGDFHFLFKSGFNFNFAKINYIRYFFGDFYSPSTTGSYNHSTKYLIQIDKPVVSWLLGMGVSYDVSERLNLSFNIDYKPLVYSTVYWEKLSLHYDIKVSEQIVYETNETFESEKEFIETFEWLPQHYDFTTLGVGIGIKYYFGFNKNMSSSN